jgi:hypothetical protein
VCEECVHVGAMWASSYIHICIPHTHTHTHTQERLAALVEKEEQIKELRKAMRTNKSGGDSKRQASSVLSAYL